MKLLLIRHGQSTGNVNPTAYLTTPDSKIPLTEKGEEQARAVGEQLRNIKVDYMYRSPFKRTRDTSTLILEKTGNIPVKESMVIKEQQWPQFKSLKEREIFQKRRELSGEPFFFKEDTYESWYDVALRAELFLTQLVLTHSPDDVIVVVSHECFLRMLIMVIDGTPYEDSYIKIDNCSIIEREV